MFHKYSLILLLTFLTGITLSCHIFKHNKAPVLMPGTWQAQPVIIDGDSKDWPSPYPNYDSKAKIGYATSNDEQNLYITMETGDELTQMKILKNGMVVTIDTSGKKGDGFVISYPLQNDNEIFEVQKSGEHLRKEQTGPQVNKQFGQKVKKAAGLANQLALDKFIDCSGAFLISQPTPCGINVKLAIDQYNDLVWEAVIPFKSIYGKQSISKTDFGRGISVCFAIKGYKKPETKSTAGDNNSMGQSGMNSGGRNANGARMNSMHGAGARAVQENPMAHLYESSKTWKQFSIAGKP